MGATPIYALPWPEESDPPDGPVQMRAISERVEAVLHPVDLAAAAAGAAAAEGKNNPQLPASVCNLLGTPGLFAGGSPVTTATWTGFNSAGALFVTLSGTTVVRFTKAGLYLISAFVRATMDTPSTTAQYVQMQGTGALAGWDSLAQFGLSALADVSRLGILRVLPAWIGNASADGTITAHVWTGPANGKLSAGAINIVRLGD